MSYSTFRHNLPLLAPLQAKKHLTLNQTISDIDRILHPVVTDLNAAELPGEPSPGQAVILRDPDFPVGHEQEFQYAMFDGVSWTLSLVQTGQLFFDLTSQSIWVFTGSEFVPVGTNMSDQTSLPLLGIGTDAKDDQRLAVKSQTIYFSAPDAQESEGGNFSLIVNKAATSDIGAVQFHKSNNLQAEMGAIGDDNFTIKTADQDGVLKTRLVLDKSDNKVGFGTHPGTQFDIRADRENAISYFRYSNYDGGSNSGACMLIEAANNQNMSFLQYGSGECYLYSTSSTFYIQNTGPNAMQRFFLSGQEALRLSASSVTVFTPLKLPVQNNADLPAASEIGQGGIAFHSVEGVIYSDGVKWRRIADDSPVTP